MRDLTLAIQSLNRTNDRATPEQVLKVAGESIDAETKASWENHIVNQAMHILDQRLRFLAYPQEREEHAQLVNLIKHLSEIKP